MTRPARCRRPLVLVTLVCFMAACHHWVAVEPPVEQTLAEHDGEVRLTLEDGRRVEVNSGGVALAFLRAQRDTALSNVAKAEVRKSDIVGTVGLLLGAVAAYVVLISVL